MERRSAAGLAALCILAGIGARVAVAGAVSLFDPEAKTLGWTFDNGREFPGAAGGLTVETLDGAKVLKLTGDFTKGGNYVQAGRRLPDVPLASLSLRVKDADCDALKFRVVDASGQCHQIVYRIGRSPDWRKVVFPLQRFYGQMGKPDAVTDVARYEHWGGPNDGRWHGPAKGLYFLLSPEGDTKLRALMLGDIQAVVAPEQPAAGPAAAKWMPLDEAADGPLEWGISLGQEFPGAKGKLEAATDPELPGKRCVRLAGDFTGGGAYIEAQRPLRALDADDIRRVRFRIRTDSARRIGFRLVDATGQTHQKRGGIPVEPSGKWQQVALDVSEVAGSESWGGANDGKWRGPPRLLTVILPANASPDSKTPSFLLGDVEVEGLAPSRRKEIDRALFATERLGNLLLPGDKPEAQLTLVAIRPLPADRRTVRYALRDYWGAEQMPVRTATLQPAERTRDGEPTYTATLDLAGAPIETGRYYEVHIEVPRPGGEAFKDFASLAWLPPAEAKKHPWRDVPFTCRNWDNRITEYFLLADRLGLRTCGIWSGWDAAAPYKTHAPGFEHIRKFDMGAVMGTPGHAIEYHTKGYEKYDAKALSEGAARLVREYNGEGRVLLCLGNEPHGKGAKVLEDVAAYKALYEGAKSADPEVHVLGTSVGPEEEYFAAGFGQYCDVYDFHTYDDVEGIRRTFRRYGELFAKYGHRKPIWSTELGLNSQGMTRLAVASDLVRKFATFFACGGQNASWFCILYPDPKGTGEGSSGQAHNVFFCRYNRYCPKLDAIAYYNVVNGICVKKLAAERQYGSIRAVLFRDAAGHCLQVLWNDGPASDMLVPLPGVEAVRLVRIDGSIAELHAAKAGLTLRVGADPMLLLYDGATGELPEKLGAPAASLAAAPEAMVRGASAEIAVRLADLQASDVSLQAPPGWAVAPVAGGQNEARFRATAPSETGAREASFRAVLSRDKRTVGELCFRIPVRSVLDATLLPDADAQGTPLVRLVLRNNAPEPREVAWRLALPKAVAMKDGEFNPASAAPPGARFAFLGWFGDVQSKQIDSVGDLILTE